MGNWYGQGFPCALPASCEVSLLDILLEHSLRVEKGAVERDAMAHHVGKTIPLVVEVWNHGTLQLFIKRRGVTPTRKVDLEETHFRGNFQLSQTTRSGERMLEMKANRLANIGSVILILCSLFLLFISGCIGVNQIQPAPFGVNANDATAPDGTRPTK
jgi:hypothetical protein